MIVWSVFLNFLAMCQSVLALVVCAASSHTCAYAGDNETLQNIHCKRSGMRGQILVNHAKCEMFARVGASELMYCMGGAQIRIQRQQLSRFASRVVDFMVIRDSAILLVWVEFGYVWCDIFMNFLRCAHCRKRFQ